VNVAVASVAAGVLLAVVTVALALRLANGDSGASAGLFRGSEPPVTIALPEFALRDQNGGLVRRDELRGKVVVLTFLDTKCSEACPIIAGQIAHAWTLLGPVERRQTVAIAISTDPRDDTPASIRAFLSRHRAAGTIRYLTGSVPDMKRLWRRLQILSSLQSGEADIHSAPVRIYGRDLTWLATQHAGADLTPANLAHDVSVAHALD